MMSTERLLLEPLRVEHAEEMVGVLGAQRLYEFIGGEPPILKDLRDRYRLQIAGSGRPNEVWRNWVIRAGDGRAIGFVQADVSDEAAELAWVVGVDDQGHGYASEAAMGVRDQLRIEGSTRFEAFIHPEHIASQAVARHVGMTRTGDVDDEGEEQWSTR